MSRTDHRTRVTRMLIRRAFAELMRRKPIQDITIKELCGQAGINRGTFYAHYKDIYDLREQMEAEFLVDFQAALRPLLEQEAGDPTPLSITNGIFECLRNNADVCAVTLGPNGDKAFADRLVNIGRDRCMEGYSKYFPQASPKEIALYYAFVSAGCIGLLEKWVLDGMAASAQELAAAAAGIMMHGIGYLASRGKPETL